VNNSTDVTIWLAILESEATGDVERDARQFAELMHDIVGAYTFGGHAALGAWHLNPTRRPVHRPLYDECKLVGEIVPPTPRGIWRYQLMLVLDPYGDALGQVPGVYGLAEGRARLLLHSQRLLPEPGAYRGFRVAARRLSPAAVARQARRRQLSAANGAPS
jgi:hypothetical protein